MASSLVKSVKRFGLINGIKVYKAIKKKGSISLTLPGLKHQVKMRSQTSDKRTFKKIFLDREYDINLSFIPKFILDAGAYIGLSPIYFSLKYPEAKIVCIEPSESNYQLLIQNAQSPNITCIKGAVWSHSGRVNLIDSINHNGYQVIETEHGSIKAYSIEEIMLMHEMTHIDILKLDVEGAELEIFSRGFENWLLNTKVIMIELHDRKKSECSEVFYNAINRYGFKYYSKGENEIAIRQDI
jgi:FkbM family methyltransferase